MFLNKLKDFFIKKKFKNGWQNVLLTDPGQPVKTVGVLFDEAYFTDQRELFHELLEKDIRPQDIHFLVYKDSIKKNQTFEYPVVSPRDVSWAGEIESKEALDFVNTPFDLLISYYDVEKALLMLLTQRSKAAFKVGFSSTDSRLHHLMIGTAAENYNVFTHELFKYLKILNKR